jgi:AraC-like DNA-binding protein
MQKLSKHKSLDPYVTDIFLIENNDEKAENSLPFYADGYPGIVYSESNNAFFLRPRNKKLSDFYLFGQAIVPISLYVKGSFKLIVLRLYPFAVRILLGINPKILNDDCFDLKQLPNIDTKSVVERLRKTEDISAKLNGIVSYVNELVKLASANTDNSIKLALNLIISAKGNTTIREVHEQLYITERTFERRFSKEIGVTPKQFASIIQFSSSMNELTENDFCMLTDIGLDSGYADQSHFIRTFKKYTGKTPSNFLKLNRI